MPRGGKRPGAGRKKGGGSKKTAARRAIIEQAVDEGITPLEVLLALMRHHYAQKEYREAAAIARDAAPYVHSRKAAVEHSGSIGVEVIEDAGWYGNTAHEAATDNSPGPAAPGADPA